MSAGPSRNFLTLFVQDLPRSRDWYTQLLGYRVAFDSDWFVQLESEHSGVELGLIRHDHDLVPQAYRALPKGGMLTVVVADVDAVHTAALESGIAVVEPPKDQFYGQRRMLVTDPDGWLVDISSECPPDPDWLASLGG